MFCLKAGSFCLVYSRTYTKQNEQNESYLLNTNKSRANFYGGEPDSFQTENSFQIKLILNFTKKK